MRVTIRGEYWKLKFSPYLGGDYGVCDYDKRELRIAKGQGEKDTLDTLIHEALHAAMKDTDESAVEQTAQAIAEMLWKLGYRRKEERSGKNKSS